MPTIHELTLKTARGFRLELKRQRRNPTEQMVGDRIVKAVEEQGIAVQIIRDLLTGRDGAIEAAERYINDTGKD